MEIGLIKQLLMEEQYPYFTDTQLKNLSELYPNQNQLMYVLCSMKAKVDKIKIGPIEIESNADMWNGLAQMYLAQYQEEMKANGTTKSLTGKIMRRADEY